MKKFEAQLPDLQKKEEETKNELKEIFNIPFTYWDEDALSAMLQYINDFEASNWERLTDLYKEDEYRRMMIGNSRMTLEEAKEQTRIANQTRNAARVAAFGALASALRR